MGSIQNDDVSKSRSILKKYTIVYQRALANDLLCSSTID